MGKRGNRTVQQIIESPPLNTGGQGKIEIYGLGKGKYRRGRKQKGTAPRAARSSRASTRVAIEMVGGPGESKGRGTAFGTEKIRQVTQTRLCLYPRALKSSFC